MKNPLIFVAKQQIIANSINPFSEKELAEFTNLIKELDVYDLPYLELLAHREDALKLVNIIQEAGTETAREQYWDIEL